MDRLLQPVVGDNRQEKFCVEMMKRLNIQRRDEHLCDVILEVGSGDHQARLKAHKIVLCAASPFFYNTLNIDMTEKKEGSDQTGTNEQGCNGRSVGISLHGTC